MKHCVAESFEPKKLDDPLTYGLIKSYPDVFYVEYIKGTPGKVLLQKSAGNLQSNVLDTGEFFWRALQALCQRVMEYLELLNSRFSVLQCVIPLVDCMALRDENDEVRRDASSLSLNVSSHSIFAVTSKVLATCTQLIRRRDAAVCSWCCSPPCTWPCTCAPACWGWRWSPLSSATSRALAAAASQAACRPSSALTSSTPS